MEKSSHYYAVLAMARICGAKKDIAEKIAYASGFVDDNTSDNIVLSKIPKGAENICQNNDDLQYIAKASSCHNYFKPSTITYHAMILNMSLFHFFPVGDIINHESANTFFTKRIRCRKDSPSINRMINVTLDKNPEVFGMVLHVFADTFAHQGFSGFFSKENDIDNLKWKGFNPWLSFKLFLFNLINYYFPTYGHMQALGFPDDPSAEWIYKYDRTNDYSGRLNPDKNMEESVRINSKEFKEAFERISEIIIKYLNHNPHFKMDNHNMDVELKDAFFHELAMKKKVKSRERSWRKFMVQNKLFTKKDRALKYDKFRWIIEAFPQTKKKYFKRYEISTPQDPAGKFCDTSWFKFISGVLWFKEEALKILREEFGLTIPHP